MEFLRGLPHGILVIGLLGLGVVGVIFYQPLASVCDPQIAHFQAQFVGDLFSYQVKDTKAMQTAPPRMRGYQTQCKEGASSGACYQYFEVVRRIVTYIHQSDEACYPEFRNVPTMYETLKASMRLTLFFAWGDGPATEALTDIQGWLKEYELSVFCDMQSGLRKMMSDEEFEELKWGLIDSLPAKESGKEVSMSVDQKAQRSLFRIPCQFF